MLKSRVRISSKELAEFCKRNHILKLSLFGSVLHDSFNSDSDIDILVEFDPEFVPGFALIRMEDELSTILGGRKVDLGTPKFLNRRIRSQTEVEGVVQYAKECR